jgi:hypothetical protein
MELRLPLDKIKKICAESRAMMRAKQVSGRALARLVGKMNATSQVIPPAPLFFRYLQMTLADTLNKHHQCYEAQVSLSQLILQGQTDVVGQPHGEMEWEIHPQEGDRYGNRLRCIAHRVGCSMPEPTDRRSIVPNRTLDAYKLPRTAGNYINFAIHTFLKNKSRLLESGQHYNCGIHRQFGRHSLQGLGRLGQESMDVVPGTEHSHHSATPARCAKRDCGVTDNEVSVRLATEPCPVQQDCQSLHGVQ